jgi:excisionase family DNA binding protein
VLLGVTEAAKKLGISEQSVRVLLAEGRLKGKKVGGTWVVQGLSDTRMRPGRKGMKKANNEKIGALPHGLAKGCLVAYSMYPDTITIKLSFGAQHLRH